MPSFKGKGGSGAISAEASKCGIPHSKGPTNGALLPPGYHQGVKHSDDISPDKLKGQVSLLWTRTFFQRAVGTTIISVSQKLCLVTHEHTCAV